MNLKPQPNRPAAAETPAPAWGILAAPGEPVGTIRFETRDGSHTFPYHALACWVLRLGTPEILEVTAGEHVVHVRGRGLAAVRDAMEAGRLRALSPSNPRYSSRSVVVVSGIVVDERARPRNRALTEDRDGIGPVGD